MDTKISAIAHCTLATWSEKSSGNIAGHRKPSIWREEALTYKHDRNSINKLSMDPPQSSREPKYNGIMSASQNQMKIVLTYIEAIIQNVKQERGGQTSIQNLTSSIISAG